MGPLVPRLCSDCEGWNPAQPGDGAVFTITDARFGRKAPDAALYTRPAGAKTDASPSKH